MGLTLEGLIGRSAISEQEREYVCRALPKGGRLLEVGTLDGVSVAWWARERPDCEFITVDPFRVGHGTGSGSLENWKRNRRENQRLFVGTLQDLHGWDRQFDRAFVDGDHTYNACLADMKSAEPMICIRGTLFVHDYAHRSNLYRGVATAVEEFVGDSSFCIREVVDTMAVLKRGESDSDV